MGVMWEMMGPVWRGSFGKGFCEPSRVPQVVLDWFIPCSTIFRIARGATSTPHVLPDVVKDRPRTSPKSTLRAPTSYDTQSAPSPCPLHRVPSFTFPLFKDLLSAACVSRVLRRAEDPANSLVRGISRGGPFPR